MEKGLNLSCVCLVSDLPDVFFFFFLFLFFTLGGIDVEREEGGGVTACLTEEYKLHS